MPDYHYVALSDIAYKGTLSDTQVEAIILVVERFIEWYAQEIFYEKAHNFKFDGNGKRSVFFQGMPDIVTCTKIEKVSSPASGDTFETISSGSYAVEIGSITFRYNRWTIGILNYKFTGTIGHGDLDLDGNNDDFYYTRTGIPEAVKTLVNKIINEHFDHTGGGTVKSTPSKDNKQKETLGDYSYTLKNMQNASLSSDNPTGNSYADMILRTYQNRAPVFAVLDDQQEADVYDSLYEVLYLGSD